MNQEFEIKIENIFPKQNYILVEPIKVEEAKTKGGIYLTTPMGSQGATPVIGVAKKVGEMSWYRPGQTLMFRRYSVDEIKVIDQAATKTFYFIQDEDVIAVINQQTNG